MAKRQCQGKTKAGKPCKAAPLSGSDYCLAHADEETRESAGFGGSQPGAGRPRVPRATELMREWVEENAEKILKPYADAIEHAVLTATFEGVVLPSDVADLGARIAAAERLLDRVLGKPAQRVEHAGPQGDAVAVDLQLDGATREAIAGALRGRPATRS
jgi:hypothetical protein